MISSFKRMVELTLLSSSCRTPAFHSFTISCSDNLSAKTLSGVRSSTGAGLSTSASALRAVNVPATASAMSSETGAGGINPLNGSGMAVISHCARNGSLSRAVTVPRRGSELCGAVSWGSSTLDCPREDGELGMLLKS